MNRFLLANIPFDTNNPTSIQHPTHLSNLGFAISFNTNIFKRQSRARKMGGSFSRRERSFAIIFVHGADDKQQ